MAPVVVVEFDDEEVDGEYDYALAWASVASSVLSEKS